MAWQVVIFTEENRVDAIPKAWIINEDLCYWPSRKRKVIVSLIIEDTEPDKNWPVVKIRLLGKNKIFDDYDVASRAAERACFTSDLNTESESEKSLKNKRKIIPNRRYISSSSESEEVDNERKIATPPKPGIDLERGQSHSQSLLSKTCKSSHQLEQNRASGSSEASLRSSVHGSSQGLKDLPRDLPSNSTDKEMVLGKLCSRVSYLTLLIKGIANDIAEIKLELNNLTKKTELLPNDDMNTEGEYKFPFSTKKEFEDFDSTLSEKEAYEKMVRYMVRVGGNKPYDFIKRIMSRVMTDQLGSMFSYTGHKGKNPFHGYFVSKALKDAAQRIPSLEKHSHYEIEEKIKTWLRHAQPELIKWKKKTNDNNGGTEEERG